MSNNNDLKRRLIAAFPVTSWPEWATCIAVDEDNTVFVYGLLPGTENMPTKFAPKWQTIGPFAFEPDEDWRDTLTTREEAQQISRPEFPDDWQRVLITTKRDEDELIQIVGYRYEGMWFECRIDGDEIFSNPVIDWQYLPKSYTNE